MQAHLQQNVGVGLVDARVPKEHLVVVDAKISERLASKRRLHVEAVAHSVVVGAVAFVRAQRGWASVVLDQVCGVARGCRSRGRASVRVGDDRAVRHDPLVRLVGVPLPHSVRSVEDAHATMAVVGGVAERGPIGFVRGVVGGVAFAVAAVADDNVRGRRRVGLVEGDGVGALVGVHVTVEDHGDPCVNHELLHRRAHGSGRVLVLVRGVGVVPRVVPHGHGPRRDAFVDARAELRVEPIELVGRVLGVRVGVEDDEVHHASAEGVERVAVVVRADELVGRAVEAVVREVLEVLSGVHGGGELRHLIAGLVRVHDVPSEVVGLDLMVARRHHPREPAGQWLDELEVRVPARVEAVGVGHVADVQQELRRVLGVGDDVGHGVHGVVGLSEVADDVEDHRGSVADRGGSGELENAGRGGHWRGRVLLRVGHRHDLVEVGFARGEAGNGGVVEHGAGVVDEAVCFDRNAHHRVSLGGERRDGGILELRVSAPADHGGGVASPRHRDGLGHSREREMHLGYVHGRGVAVTEGGRGIHDQLTAVGRVEGLHDIVEFYRHGGAGSHSRGGGSRQGKRAKTGGHDEGLQVVSRCLCLRRTNLNMRRVYFGRGNLDGATPATTATTATIVHVLGNDDDEQVRVNSNASSPLFHSSSGNELPTTNSPQQQRML